MLYGLRSFLSIEWLFHAAQTFRGIEQIEPCNAAGQIREARMTDWRLADCVDASDQVLQPLATFASDLFQRSPKHIFKADAGPSTINANRMFDDRG